MIKIFKRVERIGRLIVERIICRVRKVFIISYIYVVFIMKNILKVQVFGFYLMINDICNLYVYFLCYSIEGRYIYKLQILFVFQF